jgi:hypothetical protein
MPGLETKNTFAMNLPVVEINRRLGENIPRVQLGGDRHQLENFASNGIMHKILPQLNVFRSLSADNCTFCPRNAGLIVLVNESWAILRETEAKKKSAQVNHFLNQGGSSDKLGLSS